MIEEDGVCLREGESRVEHAAVEGAVAQQCQPGHAEDVVVRRHQATAMSSAGGGVQNLDQCSKECEASPSILVKCAVSAICIEHVAPHGRSEEHTSELQSRFDRVCRLLL